jgi:hypothetical protein
MPTNYAKVHAAIFSCPCVRIFPARVRLLPRLGATLQPAGRMKALLVGRGSLLPKRETHMDALINWPLSQFLRLCGLIASLFMERNSVNFQMAEFGIAVVLIALVVLLLTYFRNLMGLFSGGGR